MMKNRDQYLDNIVHLRGVMIILVVLGHALSIFVGDYAGHEMIESAFGSGLRKVIYSFHMPIFMAISGFLYYFEVQKTIGRQTFDGFGYFVCKKAKRLLIPFIIVMYFWRKPLFFLADTTIYADMSFSQVIKSYMTFGTTGSLWYLYTLFVIFVVQRLFVKIIWKSDKTVWAWLFFFALVSISSTYFSGPIHHVMLYNFYFFVGAVLHRCNEKLQKSMRVVFIVCTTVSVVGTIELLIKPFDVIAGSIYGTVLATTDVVLAFLLSEKVRNICEKPIGIISDLSMGIYLFHEPVLVVLGSKMPNDAGEGVLVLNLVVIGILVSSIVTLLLRKIRCGFVLGE